jgi:hypothetical protein
MNLEFKIICEPTGKWQMYNLKTITKSVTTVVYYDKFCNLGFFEDYLVTLQDLNITVTSPGYPFRDQIKAQILEICY